MESLTAFLVKSLVSNPDAVVVETKKEGNDSVLHVFVKKEDMGRVIGKNGKIATAIRTIVRSTCGKGDGKVVLKFDEIEE